MHDGTENSAIESDQGREAPLAMDAESFRRTGHALVDSIADFLKSLPERPVTPNDSLDAIRALIDGDSALPENGTDSGELLERATRLLFDHSLFNAHPRFMGYVTSSPAPIGMLGDFLAAAVNQNVGAWRLSPVASEIEVQTVRWIAELVGYPRDCGGLLVSGGNMANIVGLLTARVAALGSSVRDTGIGGPNAATLRVYASTETHTWIQKAVDIAGLGTHAIRWIPVDARLRMNVDALRDAITEDQRAGARPIMVAATAGSVSTGAVDPLVEIARVCREAGIWLHVDGAYGGFAAALPTASDDLRALALADSVALDPHKWLYAPLEAGCVLVRHSERLREAFSYHPVYYHFGEEATNFFDFGPQNSRGFRALKVWLSLQQAGRNGYVRMIGDDIQLSRELYEQVDAYEELEAMSQDLSITTFRYVPPNLKAEIDETYLNQLNQELLERLQSSGEAFISNAVIGGRYVLRACIVNFHTGANDIQALPEIVVRHGRAVHEALQSSDVR
ncbi:pyridoxal phosphate-dependent decarboxylase family protein [Nitrincola sp. MINF-07-Sa-05]|uniref:pyridoxal phosphate-dependent decarboxylase family protein n=1 Tax=Nitrincola salilacus TaxID=3400273 RepID=UPI0039184C55